MKNFIFSLLLAIAITAFLFAQKKDIFFDKKAVENNSLKEKIKYCTEVKVEGRSMEPTLKDGDYVCAYLEKPAIDDLAVFVCKNCGLENAVVKRLKKIENDCYWVLGDNPEHSLDSRKFGFLCEKDLEYIFKAVKSDIP